MNQNTIENISIIEFPKHDKEDSSLCVFEEAVPFQIERVFEITSKTVGTLRGQHAHKECSQLLVCLYGSCLVECTDGFNKIIYELDDADRGLLIPPGIWSTQEYLIEPTILMVLCDQKYKEEEYIRNFDDFINYKGVSA